MLTYVLDKQAGPLYESLYRCIREDILAGRLKAGEKLPSKRALAAQLQVGRVTVETAYGQLLAEGFLRSREKVGYFVEPVAPRLPKPAPAAPDREQEEPPAGRAKEADFPFSVWARLLRGVMADYGPGLLQPTDPRGALPLRRAIARALYDFRSMEVAPEQIVVGAGTDFLYNLVVQLLGQEKRFALEDPGYSKIRRIYESCGVACWAVPIDRQGIDPKDLGDAQVVHITPAHHFPTGTVMPMRRRQALLQWAAGAPDRYLIEDDYDSEFRFTGRPIPTLRSIDAVGRVVYINTFSRTIAPAIRIGYMVLPEGLVSRFRERLGFYACTVPSFEQYTLARFLERGYFEKHINRMRRLYRLRRDELLSALAGASFAGQVEVQEEDAGLHFLLRVHTGRTDGELVDLCARAGVPLRTLGSYYAGPAPQSTAHTLVVQYGGLTGANARQAVTRVEKLLEEEGAT